MATTTEVVPLTCYSGQSEFWQETKYGLQLAYIIPFGLLNIWFLRTILQRKGDKDFFDDSYFKIYFADGVVSVVFLIMNVCLIRTVSYVLPVCLMVLPTLAIPDFYLTPFYYIYNLCQFAKIISTVLLSANRYTCVRFPLSHKQFWNRHITKLIIIGMFIFPALLLSPILVSKTMLYVYIGQALVFNFPDPTWARTPYARLLVGVPSLVFIIYANIFTIIKISKLGNRLKRIERALCIATAFLSSGYIVLLIMQIVLVIYPLTELYYMPKLVKVLLVTQQLLDDFQKLSGPIVILLLDKKVRQAAFRRASTTESPRMMNNMMVRRKVNVSDVTY